MKYFTIILFSFFLFTGSINAFAPVAHAETQSSVSSQKSTSSTAKIAKEKASKASKASKEKAAKIAKEKASSPKPTGGTSFTGLEKLMGYMMTKIMGLFAWLLGISAVLLDYTVFYTIIHMGSIINPNSLSAVGATWRVLRDIGNIILIFGFLAIGITTILQVNWYGGGKKMIPILLVAAVFLNFSLFISEAVIDTGNLFATQFYTQINGGQAATANMLTNITGAQNISESVKNEGISNKIMSQLGFATLYGNVTTNPKDLSASRQWYTGFLGIILFLTAAFVMFSLAFILIFRFVILLFLIIIAPIGFAGLAVPKLSGIARSWWNELFKQTIIAPILLLLLYIALRVITDTKFLISFGVKNTAVASSAWAGTLNGHPGNFAGVLLSFLIAMGLLLGVTYFAKSFGATGAKWATSMGSKMTFGATAATTSFMMRHSIGRGLNAGASRFKSSKFAQSNPMMARHFSGALDYGAKASYDFRGSKTVSEGLKSADIDAGKALKGGYRGEVEKGVKARVDFGKSLKRTKAQEAALKDAEEHKEQHLEEYEENYQRDKSSIESKYKEQLEDHEEGIKIKEAIITASASSPGVSKEFLDKAKNNLKQQKESRDALQNKQKEEIKELEKSHKENKKSVAHNIKSLKRASQANHAESLLDPLISFSAGAQMDKEAARKLIENEVKKGMPDADIERIAKILKNNEEGKNNE